VKAATTLNDFVDRLKEDLKLENPTIMYSGQNVLCGTGMYKSNNFKLELTWTQLLD
jgi:hypothetical protein